MLLLRLDGEAQVKPFGLHFLYSDALSRSQVCVGGKRSRAALCCVPAGRAQLSLSLSVFWVQTVYFLEA